MQYDNTTITVSFCYVHVKNVCYIVIVFVLSLFLTVTQPINVKLENVYAEGIGLY